MPGRTVLPLARRTIYRYGRQTVAKNNISNKTPLLLWKHGSASMSSNSQLDSAADDSTLFGPTGDLFHAEIGPDLVGKKAKIQRIFGPRSNADGLLACGGEGLAKHASFDPDYHRAQGWIRHHAVGPAVLSPVLISGLVGALTEASVPQSVLIRSSYEQFRPLIVGVQVEASVEVVAVQAKTEPSHDDDDHGQLQKEDPDVSVRRNGYKVDMKTLVARVRDGAAIAEGSCAIWIPDYLHM